jgi:predicted nucleic acid-binding protein
MNNLYLIDTSVWILALRKKFDPKIKSYVEELLDEDKIVINPIIKIELLSGTKTKKEFLRLKMRLDALPEIAMDQNIWEETQKVAFELRKKGLSLPLVDKIIFSCAKSFGCTLVHMDRHFDLANKVIKIKLKSFL